MNLLRPFLRKFIVIFFVLSWLPLFQLIAQRSGIDPRNAVDQIQPLLIYEYCRVLTSPDYTGRLTGSGGYTAAAKWIAKQLEGWGAQPADTIGIYLTPFPAPYSVIRDASMTLIILPAKGSTVEKISLEPFKDFLPLFFSDSGKQSGKAVFAGWGISAPELGYDDYAGIDVRGKFVLCFRGTPDPSDERFVSLNQTRTRILSAQKRGAAGLIYIDNDVIANPNGDRLPGFFPAIINSTSANLILREKSLQYDSLKAAMLRTKKPMSFETGTRIECTTTSRYYPDGRGYNIVGIVEGSDPLLRNECILVGAHADHCGQFKNRIFPGADDNASGTAVVLEIARTFAELKIKPKRSIVVALFGGEEEGLRGSEYFMSHLPPQCMHITAMLNFDMVGEGDGTKCSSSSADFKEILNEADIRVGTLRDIHIMDKNEPRSSDYGSFMKRGIPCLSFSSNGPHLSYHQTGDTLYRLNPDMMADAAALGFQTALLLANK